MKKRILSFSLALMMILSIVPFNVLTAFAADASHTVDASTAQSRTNALVNALAGKYFTTTQTSCGNNSCDKCKNANVIGTSWLKNTMGLVPDSAGLMPEHYYSSSGYVTSTAWSCAGFANYCLWYIYAKNSSDNVRMTKIYSGTFTKSNMDSSGVRTGDVIRVDGHHSFVYISHNSSGVTVLDSNWDSSRHNLVQKHVISWSWRGGTTMAITRGKNWSGGTHVHSYSGSNYEAAHPHRVYQKCSCGATKYTGATKTVSSCAQCTMTVDTKYSKVKGFKAYPCVSSNFEVKTSNLSTRGGEIYTTDFCTINELYTNGWCKVTFPMDSGGTRTAYTKISNFIKSPSTSLTKYTATSYINLYSTSSLSTQIYRIYPGDVCYTIGKSGSATQIFMPMSSGGYYVLGWAVLPPAQQSSGYDVPFKCRTISTEKVKCYNDINFTSSPGYIYPTDDCVITAVYSNGKVQVSCPWSDGTTKTVYVNKSVFINSSTTPKNSTAPKYAKTYLRTDMSTNIGWIDVGDKIQIVATSGSKTQIIYPADVGKRCAWVNTSDLNQTYKVTYNANGGTGAPAAQTKNHGANLTLSSTKPKRTGYTFVGWAKTASATSAAYSAGSIYSDDKNITLYAVWRKQTYTITYNANSGVDAPGVQKQTYGTAITVTNEMPSKTYTVKFDANGGTVDTQHYSFDCAFAGWNTKADGTGTTVKSGASYTPNANVTLYAIYSNPKFENYPIPSREGYTFNGWYTAASGGTRWNATTAISADTTLYAQWEKEAYSVLYYDEEATNLPAEQEKINGIDLTLSSQIPVKSGYIFKGWTLDLETNTIDYLPGAQYTNNQAVILYAVWEKEATPVTVTGISMQSMPAKTVYEQNDIFSSGGLSIKVNYSDGTSKTVTSGFTVSAPDMSTAGTKTVTVTYQDKTTSFTITVNPKEAPDPYSAKILVENKNAIIGNTVEMAVKLENNPGIASMTLKVNYDSSAMQLISVTDAGKLGTSVHSDNYASPYTLCWVNDTAKENFTENGTIVILKFQILDNAVVGNYPISISYDYDNFDIYNIDVEKVKFNTVSGSITVSNVLIGDVNSDGTVNNLDRLVLTRYLANWIDYPESAVNMAAADVNTDGVVNNLDRLILTRHLANWTGYDSLPYIKA